MIGHDHARDFLADAVRQANHAQFFDVRRFLIDLFDFVGINVLAVGVDDDVFRSSDQIEIPIVIQTTQVAGVQPAIDQRLSSRFFVAEITNHDIRTAGDDLTNT